MFCKNIGVCFCKRLSFPLRSFSDLGTLSQVSFLQLCFPSSVLALCYVVLICTCPAPFICLNYAYLLAFLRKIKIEDQVGYVHECLPKADPPVKACQGIKEISQPTS